MKKNNKTGNYISLTDMWKWHYVENLIQNVMNFFNFIEARPPILLSEEVVKKIYWSKDDKDLEKLVDKLYRIDSEEGLSLRPDGTVTYLSEFKELSEESSVNRIYYIGPMFRRSLTDQVKNGQFYQFGAEALGSSSYIVDIEIIRLGLHIFRKFGLADVGVELSSYGCKECRPSYIVSLKEFWNSTNRELCDKCSADFVHFNAEGANCPHCRSAWQHSPPIFDFLCGNCNENLILIKRALSNLMVDFSLNPRLKMSFDYYNRLVFRYKIGTSRKTSYIGGGGRYDYLAQSITGKPLDAVGLSANIDELIAVMDKRQLFHEPEGQFKVYIMSTHPDLEINLLQIVQELHDNDIRVIIGNTEDNSRKQYELAAAEGFSLMLVLDNVNIREGKATIYNLVKNHQEFINISAILNNVTRLKKALTNDFY